jgi:hypothetical protein
MPNAGAKITAPASVTPAISRRAEARRTVAVANVKFFISVPPSYLWLGTRGLGFRKSCAPLIGSSWLSRPICLDKPAGQMV